MALETFTLSEAVVTAVAQVALTALDLLDVDMEASWFIVEVFPMARRGMEIFEINRLIINQIIESLEASMAQTLMSRELKVLSVRLIFLLVVVD